MSTSVGSIHYDLSLKTDKFESQADAISGKLKNIGGKMQSVGTKMSAFVTVPIVAGAGLAIKAASDLEETMNKVDVSFGKSATSVIDWSKTSIKSMGLAQQSALDAAALFGDMGTGMGQTQKEASKMSTSLTQLGADMASFKNVSFERAQIALAGVYTGETEALKSLGIVMTQTNLEEFARAEGISKSIKEMTQAEKVQLRYKYVMSVTSNAQGDFARTADGAANQTRMVGERVKQLSADIGTKLMPIYMKLLKVGNQVLDWFNDLTDAQKNMILIVAGVAAAIGPLLLTLGLLISAVGSLVAILASPVFYIVTAVLAGIAAAAYLVYTNWARIKPAVDIVTNTFQWFWNIIKPIREFMARQLSAAIAQVKKAWVDLRTAIAPIMPLLSLVGRGLLALVGILAGAVVAAFIGAIVVVARAIASLARFIAWSARTANSMFSMANSAGAAMGRFINSVAGGIQRAINWFAALPGRIRGALGNLSGLLWGAGSSIIQGLLDGIKSKFEEVKGFVGGIGAWMQENKGPIEKDRVLLIEQGQAIMQGFNKGLLTGYKDVQKTVRSVNGDLQGNVGSSMSASTTVNGNIYIGNKQDADYFMQRMTRSSQLAAMGLAG